jgi:sec-independent protein translocase protein TatB
LFGIGPFELIIIAVGALVFVGPDRLPGAMKEFGKWFIKAKRTSAEFKNSFDTMMQNAERELDTEELRKHQIAIQDQINSIKDDVTDTESPSSEKSNQSPEFSVSGSVASHHHQSDDQSDPFEPYLEQPRDKDS